MSVLRRLQLENLGCFPAATLDLAPFTALVGPGDAGKSTLLAAIQLYRMLAAIADRFEDDISVPLGLPALRRRQAGPDARCTVAMEGTLPAGEGEDGAPGEDAPLPFAATAHLKTDDRWVRLARQEMRLGDEGWSWRADTGRIALESPADEALEPMPGGVWFELDVDYAAPSPWSEDFEEDIYALHEAQQRWLPAFLHLRRALLSCRTFRLAPAALRAPSPPAQGDGVPALGEDGAGLPTVLSVLAGAARHRVDAIEAALVRAVPWLAGFQIRPTARGDHRLVFVLGDAGPQRAPTRIEADRMGDGVLLLLGYLTLRHHPTPPALVLVEEPERCMHPRWLGDLAALFRGMTEPDPAPSGEGAPRPPSQVVLATHAPALLDAMRPDEAFFLHRGADGAGTVTRFDAIPDIETRLRETSLGTLWTSLGEDALYELAHGPAGG